MSIVAGTARTVSHALAKAQVDGQRVIAAVGKHLVGAESEITQVWCILLAGGHVLIEGIPGTGKTTCANLVGRAIDLPVRNRIQCTPDLLPGDIAGSERPTASNETGAPLLEFQKGPIFSNLVVADELNRTPPKVQSAFLQAMQEFEVTVRGVTYPLPVPFFVVATQNPRQDEVGTYPLPYAQLDRFSACLRFGRPTRDKLGHVAAAMLRGSSVTEMTPVIDIKRFLELRTLVESVPVTERALDYAVGRVELVATDPEYASLPVWGNRAVLALIRLAQARAVLDGRASVSRSDILAFALPVLRHRVELTFRGEREFQGGVDEWLQQRLAIDATTEASDVG